MDVECYWARATEDMVFDVLGCDGGLGILVNYAEIRIYV